MDWRSYPPLSALRAFSAFANSQSLEQAGASIGVTHAAISQQIRALEAHLGLRLVERSARRLSMTGDGLRLAAALNEGFGLIGKTLAALLQSEHSRPLRLTTTPAFASGWLMPRLPDFRARHPGYELMIDATGDVRRLGEDADIALRFGNGDWPGTVAQLVLHTPVVVVASPALVPPGTTASLDDLARLPWLQELGTNEASAFLQTRGISRAGPTALMSLPGNLMMDAARDGQGIAVIARAFVEADIAAGRLRVLHEDREREGYFLVTPPGPHRPAVQAFCDWVAKQARPV